MALKRPQVIKTLEELSSSSTKRLSVKQVNQFVALLRAGTSCHDIAKKLKISETEVIDLGAQLGTWLTHVSGSVDAEVVYEAHQQQATLFRPTDDSTVVIPHGFERRVQQRRDIGRALTAVIVHNPDESVVSRFIDRLYPSQNSALAARDVFVVWRFAQIGRISGLADIAESPAFCRTMASAYFLLETAVLDAENSIALLSDSSTSIEALTDACVKARWVNESRISRLERLVDLAHTSVSANEMLRRGQDSFAREVKAVPRNWTFTSVEQLSEGQVLRIVQSTGLVSEESSRREALEIRSRLVEIDTQHESDLTKDLDLLVPEGLRAKRAGLESEFWDAVVSRAEGNSNWRSQLDKAFAASTRTA